MVKKYGLASLMVAALGVTSASASMILGFGVEADAYVPTTNGHFDYKGGGLDSKTTFDEKTQSTYQLGLYLEHPIPLVPNLRIDMTPDLSIEATGSNNGLSSRNKIDFKQYDITPYYEILDNLIDLDVGVTFKMIDAKVSSTTGTSVINDTAKITVPMGYIGVGLTIPMSNIRLQGDVKYVSFDGDHLTDAKAKIVMKTVAGLELQGGYRYEQLKITDRGGVTADLEIKGPFFGAGYSY